MPTTVREPGSAAPSRRAMRPSAFLAAVLLAGLALPLVALAAGGYVLEREGRSAEVPVRLLARREMVDLEASAKFFGLQVRRERKRLELVGDQGVITLQVGRAAIVVNSEPVLLGSEVDVEDGRVLVPLDFLTRAMPRFLGEDVRHDGRARTIRYDPKGGAVTCERFDDRMRITVKIPRRIASPDISADGTRRIVTLTGVSLPPGTGGCPFDETLQDLQVASAGGSTTLTLFTGPRFGGLEVQEMPEVQSLVIDVLESADAGTESAGPAATAPPSSRNDAFDTIVIDPGHGGEDRGARGPGGTEEKALVLGIAQALAEGLRSKGLRVVLTRSADTTVGLTERTEIANRERADLFLSLHANASPSGPATGAETYFLHLDATDEAARSIAAAENDATGLRARGAGGDDLEMLLWDMAQQQYLDESSRLADAVQRELNELLGTKDRGVKQANFLVLRGATMPAILVEVGFISSPAEERRMRTAEFRAQTADALLRAILAFRDARSARQGP